jgi:hypothetical protein
MTMVEFRQLELPEQIADLYEHGVYLGKRKEEELAVLLYQLDCFYVEVFYKTYRKDVLEIQVSESVLVLDPYLEQIDLEFLVSEL